MTEPLGVPDCQGLLCHTNPAYQTSKSPVAHNGCHTKYVYSSGEVSNSERQFYEIKIKVPNFDRPGVAGAVHQRGLQFNM